MRTSAGGTAAAGSSQQLGAYKSSLGERKHNLDDDFIKFLRWGQYWIDQSGRGILAMVTNNTYLNGLTHRQMRASLAATFDHIYVLDLHGNSKKRERTPSAETSTKTCLASSKAWRSACL